jgi:hypothetical protein
MADRALHNYLCKKILGEEHDRINAFLDSPARVLGPNHRIVFHDAETIGRIGMFDFDSGVAAMLHKILDENKELEKVLRVMAVMDRFSRDKQQVDL